MLSIVIAKRNIKKEIVKDGVKLNVIAYPGFPGYTFIINAKYIKEYKIAFPCVYIQLPKSFQFNLSKIVKGKVETKIMKWEDMKAAYDEQNNIEKKRKHIWNLLESLDDSNYYYLLDDNYYAFYDFDYAYICSWNEDKTPNVEFEYSDENIHEFVSTIALLFEDELTIVAIPIRLEEAANDALYDTLELLKDGALRKKLVGCLESGLNLPDIIQALKRLNRLDIQDYYLGFLLSSLDKYVDYCQFSFIMRTRLKNCGEKEIENLYELFESSKNSTADLELEKGKER